VPVSREPALVRDDARHDVELEPIGRFARLDERAGLGNPTQDSKRCNGRLRSIPVTEEAAIDDERSFPVDRGVDELEWEVIRRTHAPDVREQVRFGVLRDPEGRVHSIEQRARLGKQPPGVADALASLVDVPAGPHDGQTIGVEIESSSPEETEAVGARIAEGLSPGDVVTVSGELGTGKTTLVRGGCRVLGVEGPVTSPTYTIGHRYSGRVDVSHLDLYRFAGVSAAEWGDLEPYFADAVCFVEWPEAGKDVLPPPRFAVSLAHAGERRRHITVDEC
jgi:tRNA threonylcarbamoyladenosine biosynthesis protein TsaE